MTVYVDDMKAAFGNMLMCHMWADGLDELLHMAERIGVARKWIQGHPQYSIGKARDVDWLHFDIAQSKRLLAVRYGAQQTNRYGPMLHTACLDVLSQEPRRVERGFRKLQLLEGKI